MHPNDAKSFPAATLPTAANLGRRRRGKRRTQSKERRKARMSYASEQKCRQWRSRGVLGVLHPTRRKDQCKNLDRKHLELSERRRVFARKKRRVKWATRKAARMTHKAARARSRPDELTFDTFNVRTAAVNGIVDIDTLLRLCPARGCDVIGLQETKRDGTFEIVASGYRV